jgi:hypothetical protein
MHSSCQVSATSAIGILVLIEWTEMDNPKWTTPNGQLQMDSCKWTRRHYRISYELIFYEVQQWLRVHLQLSIWDCPFEAVHLGLSIRGSASHPHYRVTTWLRKFSASMRWSYFTAEEPDKSAMVRATLTIRLQALADMPMSSTACRRTS